MALHFNPDFDEVQGSDYKVIAKLNPQNELSKEAAARFGAAFAAAPLLASALQGYVDDHDADQRELCRDAGITYSPCDCDRCLAARAALAQARGEGE